MKLYAIEILKPDGTSYKRRRLATYDADEGQLRLAKHFPMLWMHRNAAEHYMTKYGGANYRVVEFESAD